MKIAAFSIADYSEATEGMPHDVERLYFRMLLKMYSREGGLPDNDADNARILGYRDVRTYKALKAKLLKWPGAIIAKGGLLTNERAEKDIADAHSRREKAVENGRIGGRSRRDQAEIAARSDGVQPEIDPRSGAELGSIAHTTNNENKDLAEASPSPTPSPPPSPIEKPLPVFSSDRRERVSFDGSRLTLKNGLKQHWLAEFGGDEHKLDLALTRAASYVQANSSRSLEVQVSSQLARIVSEKLDRDERYRAAASAKAEPAAPKFVSSPTPLPSDPDAEERAMKARVKKLVDAACEGVAP